MRTRQGMRCVSGHMHTYVTGPGRVQKRVLEHSGDGVTDACELPDLGVGNPTRVALLEEQQMLSSTELPAISKLVFLG